MTGKIVLKFGGSNLKRREDILKVITAISSYKKPVVVVVSAFYGITDYLAGSVVDVITDGSGIEGIIRHLQTVAKETISKNISCENGGKLAMKAVMERILSIAKYLRGINYIGEIPSATEDLILSYGERISSCILTEVLKFNGVLCEEMLPEKLGLITDGEYGNATVDFTVSEEKVKEQLSDNKIFIVPGFYGISRQGRVTLLGRGGSDYSAASIARCISADSLDIWKDVDGFLSGDPKLVNNPLKISRLSYNEASELAYFGARILHPRTVEPLSEKSIPVRIFNINSFNSQLKPLSIIDNRREVKGDIIKSVTYSDDIGILKLKGAGVGSKAGVLARVTAGLVAGGINIRSVITSQTTITLLFSLSDLTKAHRVAMELNLHTVCDIDYDDNLSLVACVGEGITEQYGVAGRMFKAVSYRNINIRAIFFGSSQVAVYFIVDIKDKTSAVNEIHREFFGVREVVAV